MTQTGTLLERIMWGRRIIILGAIAGASYFGYKQYEKHKTKLEIRQNQEIMDKTLDFLLLKTDYISKQDSLDKIHNEQNRLYDSLSTSWENEYTAKKDSLMKVHFNSFQK